MIFPTLIAAVCLTQPLGAETIYRCSAEWLTSESSLIFVGAPVDRSVWTTPAGVRFGRARYRLDDVLKGPQSSGDTATIYTLLPNGSHKEWLDDRRHRLCFCKVAPESGDGMEGKYTDAAGGTLRTSFPVGVAIDGYFTPELQPITLYEELEGRARRQVAWEDLVRGLTDTNVVEVMRGPRLAEPRRDVVLPGLPSRHAQPTKVRWPLFLDGGGEPLLRWPEERDRAPARFEFRDRRVKFTPLKGGTRAFSNRRYVWGSIPPLLRGWQCSKNQGGAARSMEARASVSGHVFLAVESHLPNDLRETGWTPAAIDGDLAFSYNDHRSTTMTVFSKYFAAGEVVTFPAAGWTGSVVLVPPAWL